MPTLPVFLAIFPVAVARCDADFAHLFEGSLGFSIDHLVAFLLARVAPAPLVLTRKIKNQAYQYDIEVDAGFGVRNNQVEHEAAEKIQGVANKVAKEAANKAAVEEFSMLDSMLVLLLFSML
eukprot:CAMPEP_0168285630 /NCGR_PEP_ID=MMETSP0142_2-20121227/197_1 /TAXON_ID=44445 /ORGANISM="Pseudo-nitzschia australis, Strain 10249 10 AB" /LENGTH=121 /DNA_ID=CAMNT_0008229827 /DNA_START=344 /DNA_END=707 /DNA_ORIENTATION=-